MDPFIPVPPVHYGGIERVIADLADGLVRRGHDVTLWAAPESRTSARLSAFGRAGEWTRWSNVRNTLVLTGRFLRHRGGFDVIHNFGRLAYLLAVLRADVVKVQTYMRPVNPRNMQKVRALGGRRLRYTAVSVAIRDTGQPGGGDWSVVPNGASASRFPFNPAVDARTAPLMFLGRLERCKGAHTAIAVARRAGRRLVIAGNLSPLPHERAYYEREVAPLVDNRQVTYVGPVDDRQKGELLRKAAALLLPVEWDEPFPVVLPEALLSGTPVVAFRRGGIPEGIVDGQTGFVCDSADEMVARIADLPSLDRSACRADAERRFTDEAIVSAYEAVYEELIAEVGRG
ncbi:MAG: glycosyltransferase [Acidobacteriota bacterium]|nr:glycosyltransferase [Acidobacteriota bacterium]